jgi:ethanolamine ammonia-lyase small subunit
MAELRAALGETPGGQVPSASPSASRPSSRTSGGPQLPCGPAPADKALLERLKKSTIAQIGVGRAGVRLRTPVLLKFLADRAVAVEAVRSQLPADFAARIGAVKVHTEARDLDEFLLRPDLGRRLPEAALEAVRRGCKQGADVQVVVGDGLSAHAVALNAPPFLEALPRELERVGLSSGTPVLIERARMRTLSVVGEATAAKTGVILLGERPGLGTGDGMSAYLVFRPRREAVESDHEVVSNIHIRGIPPAEAAKKVASLLAEFVKTGASGVARQAGAAPSAVERSRVEPSSKGDALHKREPYAGKKLAPEPPLATSAAARCAG